MGCSASAPSRVMPPMEDGGSRRHELVRSVSKWSLKPHESIEALGSTMLAIAAAQHVAHNIKQRNITRASEEVRAVKVHRLRSAASNAEGDLGEEATVIDFGRANQAKWHFAEYCYHGSYTHSRMGREEEVAAPLSEGLAKLKAEPERYAAVWYQTEMTSWPEAEQKYNLLERAGTQGFGPIDVDEGGWMTMVLAKYMVLPELADDALVRDAYTDSMSYGGQALTSALSPGRGHGVGDMPSLKLIDKFADPQDVRQGAVGDCWLLSGLSSFAEFEGAVRRLFRKTEGLDRLPLEGANQYVITLWDLSTWSEVDVVVDERLLCRPDEPMTPLGCQLARSGELWQCYVEKAVAAHCGGWDMIEGGQCTHAWALLTGCREQYVIQRNEENGSWSCFGSFNPNEKRWEPMANSPHEGFQGLWPNDWPSTGGGGDLFVQLSEEQLFERLCAWDDANFLMGASRNAGSGHSSDGIQEDHAYSLLDVVNDAAGTDVDLILMRNSHGRDEFTNGEFDDDGPGWGRHPEVKALLKPVNSDDGTFWMSKSEFFEFFDVVYLCAQDMKKFVAQA